MNAITKFGYYAANLLFGSLMVVLFKTENPWLLLVSIAITWCLLLARVGYLSSENEKLKNSKSGLKGHIFKKLK